MGRAAATALHLTLWVLGGVLYFLFVLPRWWELMGDTTHTLGTVLRIVTGVLFALAALPVLLTLLRTRKPEYATPPLALRLRLSAVVLHLLAGVLIVGTAVAEIWVSLDAGGPWLFGVYGAAAAVAILGLLAFYLAYTAELPPKAPKPKKAKKAKKKRGESADADEASTEVAGEAEAADETEEAAEPADEVAEPEETEAVDEPAEETPTVENEQPADVSAQAEPVATPEAGGLRNKRPTGKTNHRLRRRNRLAVDDAD
ncbi:hypothetical protein [Mycobacterium sp. shizuoka-1]|uniref:hypothetical protein n=1 Tax=Mycobacterium sp. shizuoka-1 TaxID=2039281 RepID=UPI000C06352F|nr:hypothetical protein [Mycobacterium sp. shizuoka-1]GAY14103.1 hypothetical protein MSZK_08290 [Mycobacterium sp. shizuoka-1]